MTDGKTEFSFCIRFRFQLLLPASILKDHGCSRHWFTCGVPDRAFNGDGVQL